jgi:hypothetical protein
MSTAAHPEPVPAAVVRPGDILVHEGREIEVLACPDTAVYLEAGDRVAGLAIRCRAPSAYPGGTATWTLYRRGGDTVHRVRQDGAP